MATAAAYQCRLSPEDCPGSAYPGYCVRHPWIELVASAGVTTASRVRRATPPAPSPRPTAPSTPPAPEPPPQPEAAVVGEATHAPDSAPTPEPVVGAWALRITCLDATVPIPPAGLDIGRDTTRFADLPGMADLDQVSRAHARLTWSGSTLTLTDLGSTNGTFVAGRRIHAPHPVAPGDELRLADDVDVELVDLDEEL
ncbi:FHA domain-containing protein [Spiractinospora alimapuensis]|uniref:FHA domain-containing protein n=1 Tax=Spiractinospora alimapuensis TaxID=2820884 RepID=UPI001F344F4D|nr:FHA domain-containing protein [Spiractinospora alimapuensis]QVQ52571.1 FHA domain-containing protein [Spiractinospora alimapuensis]